VSDQSKRIARRYFEELLNAGNIEIADEIFDPDCVLIAPPIPQGVRGAATLKEVVRGMRLTFSDLHFTITEEIAEDEKAAVRWTMRGTQQREWLGIPAGGRDVCMTGIDILELSGGKLKRIQIEADYLGAIRQLSAVPDSITA
jgi:steroid delta-isomerase-like uncharacterized protein